MKVQPVWAVLSPSTTAEAIPKLLAGARRLAESVGAPTEVVVFGEPAQEARRTLSAQGASRVYCLEGGETNASLQPAAVALARLSSDRTPRALFLPDAPQGRELAARVAARFGAGLATGCRQVEAVVDGVRAVRAAYGGRASCTLTITSHPAILTLEATTAAVVPPRGPASDCELVRVPLPHPEPGPEVLEIRPVDPFEMELEEAEVIVAGGAGVGGPEGFARLGELARRLGGAVGASRVAVDAGWVPYHRQVGQSGRVVAPRLYIACGISGAVHHLAGIRDAETVVAINTDAHAPIVPRADLALVGDVRAVVSSLIERLDGEAQTPDGAAAALTAMPGNVS